MVRKPLADTCPQIATLSLSAPIARRTPKSDSGLRGACCPVCLSPALSAAAKPKYARRMWTVNELRRLILQTACLLLRRQGARCFTVVAVAGQAGIARSTIYKYFGSRAGLLAACREFSGRHPGRATSRALLGIEPLARDAGRSSKRRRYGQPWPEVPGAPPRAHSPIVHGLYQWLRWSLQRLEDDDGDLYLLAAAESVRGRARPRQREALLPQGISYRLRDWVRQAQRAGQLRDDLPADVVVQWLGVLYWHQLFCQGPLHDDPVRPHGPNIFGAWPAEGMWRCFLQGVLPRGNGTESAP